MHQVTADADMFPGVRAASGKDYSKLRVVIDMLANCNAHTKGLSRPHAHTKGLSNSQL